MLKLKGGGPEVKVTTTVRSPVAALDGMVKFASTVPDVASEKLVAVSDPSVMLEMGALAGGEGGLPGKVMVKLMFVPDPRLTVLLPGTA